MWLFNFTRLGVKMISVIPGVLMVPFFYLLLRRFFQRMPSIFACFLFAVSSWSITLARWGWDQVLLTTMLVVVFLRIEKNVVRRSYRAAWFSGIFLGLTLYTYLAARVAVITVLFYLGVSEMLSERPRAWKPAGVFLLGVLMAGLPLFVFWGDHPAIFTARMKGVSIIPWLQGGDFTFLIENIKRYGLVFHVQGDPNARHMFPYDPLLDPLSGILMVVGMVCSLQFWRRRDVQLAWIWFSIGLAGGLLTFPHENPHAYRIGMIAPACFLFVAVAFQQGQSFFQRYSTRWQKLVLVFTTGLCLIVAMGNFKRYFVDRAHNLACWQSTWGGGPAKLIVDKFSQIKKEGRPIFFDFSLKSFEVESELRIFFKNFGQGEPDAYWGKVNFPNPVFWVGPSNAAEIFLWYPGATIFLHPKDRFLYEVGVSHVVFEQVKNIFGEPMLLLLRQDTRGSR